MFVFLSDGWSVVSDPQIFPLLPTGGRTHHGSEEDIGRENIGIDGVILGTSMLLLWWLCILY